MKCQARPPGLQCQEEAARTSHRTPFQKKAVSWVLPKEVEARGGGPRVSSKLQVDP